MNSIFNNKRVLITGGTGSFGKNFASFLLKKYNPRRLIIFSRDEFKQHYMEKELGDDRVSFFLGDVRDVLRLQRAFSGVDTVVHAAALKQVPALEYNPFEAIKTNITGTQNVIEAAIDQGVKRVLFISTDKAVQPINLYGATKLCAEKLIVSANSYAPDKTSLSAVRYGNVMGSRGSIIEFLLKNNNAKKVSITDAEMTRFWITLEQSFELVSFALKNMEGGEIFVPRIPSMKIVDLFDTLVPNAKKEITGIRPGEKIHEILLTTDESRRSVELKKCFVIIPQQQPGNRQKALKKYFTMGKTMKRGFEFSSNTNAEWLTCKDLDKMAKKIKI